jgi:hypothetical protein
MIGLMKQEINKSLICSDLTQLGIILVDSINLRSLEKKKHTKFNNLG